MEIDLATFDQKMEVLEGKRNTFDKAVTSLNSSETIKGVSRSSVEVQNEAEKLQLISLEIENEVDQVLQALKISAETSMEHFIGNHTLSVKDRRYHLHVLQEENTSYSLPHYLQFTDENDAPLTDGILTFMNFAWPTQKSRRVYMKMIGNTVRARQHLLLITGHCGHSYRDLKIFSPFTPGQPVEFLIIHPYDGNKGSPLLKDVTVTDVRHELRVGVMAGGQWDNDSNNGLIGFYLSDNPGLESCSGFGQVTSGIEILQDIAKSKQIKKIKVVDCGVVIFWQ
ncbi:unnamed protein product, partial [Meganyctiphanes norvegica]